MGRGAGSPALQSRIFTRKIPQAFLTAVVLMSSLAYAAAPNTYQVTGEITDVKDDKITVTKGKEKFEIARTADVQATGESSSPAPRSRWSTP